MTLQKEHRPANTSLLARETRFERPAFRAGREDICVVLNSDLCGGLLQQPQEAHTARWERCERLVLWGRGTSTLIFTVLRSFCNRRRFFFFHPSLESQAGLTLVLPSLLGSSKPSHPVLPGTSLSSVSWLLSPLQCCKFTSWIQIRMVTLAEGGFKVA